MFWSCTKLRQFWFSIFEILNSAFDLGIQPNPIMALFGVTGDDIHITKDKENALAFATLIARRRILLEWKSPIPPKLSLWLSDIMFFLKTEKIKYFLRGSTKAFYKTWNPLIIYIEKNILLQLWVIPPLPPRPPPFPSPVLFIYLFIFFFFFFFFFFIIIIIFFCCCCCCG